LTLAVDGGVTSDSDQRIDIQTSIEGVVLVSCTVLTEVPEQFGEPDGKYSAQLIRIQSKSAGALSLIAFPGTDAQKVRRQYRVPLPPHLTKGALYLSPDGRHLALWGSTGLISALSPSWRQELDKKAPPRVLRRGATWLLIMDLETGKQSLIGAHPDGAGAPTETRWLGWSKDGKSVLVVRNHRNRPYDGEGQEVYLIPVFDAASAPADVRTAGIR